MSYVLSFSLLSCVGATGASHCNPQWFDAHSLWPIQTLCLLGDLLERNMPIVEHERVNVRKHGHVSLNSLPRRVQESLYAFGKFCYICKRFHFV